MFGVKPFYGPPPIHQLATSTYECHVKCCVCRCILCRMKKIVKKACSEMSIDLFYGPFYGRETWGDVTFCTTTVIVLSYNDIYDDRSQLLPLFARARSIVITSKINLKNFLLFCSVTVSALEQMKGSVAASFYTVAQTLLKRTRGVSFNHITSVGVLTKFKPRLIELWKSEYRGSGELTKPKSILT